MSVFSKLFRRIWGEPQYADAQIKAIEARRFDRQQEILRELQKTMDPLVATRFYNARFCPLLSRLPEELLLCILDFCDDAVTLHCLRSVSSSFLRLLDNKSARWKADWYDDFTLGGHPTYLKPTLLMGFRRLLRKDGRCDQCRLWDETHGHDYEDCKFQQIDRPIRIDDNIPKELHCYACHTAHDIWQFSAQFQRAWKKDMRKRDRICLGQQGAVKLCEHVQIKWNTIRDYIEAVQRRQCTGEELQSCLDNFLIECRHTSHDTRCTEDGTPTFPQARLRVAKSTPAAIVLNLVWTPHQRLGECTLTTSGQISAADLRSMFHNVRSRGPADILFPKRCPDWLPEMMLFDSRSLFSPFIHYKTAEDDEPGPK